MQKSTVHAQSTVGTAALREGKASSPSACKTALVKRSVPVPVPVPSVFQVSVFYIFQPGLGLVVISGSHDDC